MPAVKGTLYAIPGHTLTLKSLIAAVYSGAKVNISNDFIYGETNRTEDFLRKFPLGEIPAFETEDGKYLVESNAIAYYVANEELRGGNKEFEKSQVLQFFDIAEKVIAPAIATHIYRTPGVSYSKEKIDVGKEEVRKVLQYLEDYLLLRTYLASERITLADIVVACTLLPLYKHAMGPNFRKPYVNLNRWFATVINQPEVKSVIGEFKFNEKIDSSKEVECVKQVSASPPKDKEVKKEQKKEEKKKKKEPTPVKETAPPADDELDPTEAALAAEPKSKDPFADLPKGTFNLEDFKRFYSNEDESKSIPYFWEKFDKDNYSIWLGEYKYNDELTKVFMSCNLITGMFQRLEKLRKNAFASVVLFGKDNDSSISGIWVWKGHGLAFELSPDWKTDYDVYQWTKLNPNDAKTKQLVENYFSWKGTDKDGRSFNQGKIFK